MKAINVFLSSVGRRTYIVQYFKEALRGVGSLHAGDARMTYALQQADEQVITPLIYSNEYIPFLLDYCEKHAITAIVPLTDIDLPVLSKHREKFEKIGTRLIISPEKVTHICNDKWQTFCFLRDNGFHTPTSWISIDEALCAIERGELTYPIFMKPRWGMGSIGITKVNSAEEFPIAYRQIARATRETLLKYESAEDFDHAILVQEFLPGDEYGLDIINDLEGNYVNTIVKRKLAMRAGETDVAQIVDVPELKALGERLSATLKHYSNCDVDVFMCDGVPYVLELNCRFGGQYPFSHIAGANLPLQIVHWLQDKSSDIELCSAKVGVTACKDLVPVKISE